MSRQSVTNWPSKSRYGKYRIAWRGAADRIVRISVRIMFYANVAIEICLLAKSFPTEIAAEWPLTS